jgi:hypothetical protein
LVAAHFVSTSVAILHRYKNILLDGLTILLCDIQ